MKITKALLACILALSAPLATCVVSGEELGSMGEPFDYVYKAPGQPDRLVRFCCESCVKKFKKNPAKYLALIDAVRDAKPAESAR